MSEELINQLDPERDYGERTLAEVKAAVKSGELILRPGHRLPVIVDARTNRAVAGTGRPPGKPAAVFSRGYFQRQMAKNAQQFWRAAYQYAIGKELEDGTFVGGDPRWGKLVWEQSVGAAMQDKGSTGGGAEDFLKILRLAAEATSTARISSEVVDQPNDR